MGPVPGAQGDCGTGVWADLEGCGLFKFGCGGGEALVKLVGKQAPIVVLPTLHTALL